MDRHGRKEMDWSYGIRSVLHTRGLDLLLPGGVLVFIIPSAFLSNNSKYNKLKEKVAAKADLVDAYRLPARMFKTTDIGTDIIVFKRKN